MSQSAEVGKIGYVCRAKYFERDLTIPGSQLILRTVK